jgi:hypothetical protein
LQWHPHAATELVEKLVIGGVYKPLRKLLKPEVANGVKRKACETAQNKSVIRIIYSFNFER